MSAPGDPIEARGDQHRPELATARQGRLEPGAAVVLARGNVLVLGNRCPALPLDEGPDAGLLRLKPQAGVVLLSGGDPMKPHRVAGLGEGAGEEARAGHQPRSPLIRQTL
nr:hypothetical protein [Pararoseomonas indoligenes]